MIVFALTTALFSLGHLIINEGTVCQYLCREGARRRFTNGNS